MNHKAIAKAIMVLDEEKIDLDGVQALRDLAPDENEKQMLVTGF